MPPVMSGHYFRHRNISRPAPPLRGRITFLLIFSSAGSPTDNRQQTTDNRQLTTDERRPIHAATVRERSNPSGTTLEPPLQPSFTGLSVVSCQLLVVSC